MSLRSTWGGLRSIERRMVIGIGVLLFIVINIFWVWPRFSDWSTTQKRISDAREKLARFQAAVDASPKIKKAIAEMERSGGGVMLEDQANNFARAVSSQAAQSGVSITGTSKMQTSTNEFFLELIQTFTVQSREEQLVEFLYILGTGDSMIRVRDISLRPDAAHQQLGGNIKLVASYQKKPPVKSTKPEAPKAAAKPAPAPDKKAAPAAPTDKKPATTKKS